MVLDYTSSHSKPEIGILLGNSERGCRLASLYGIRLERADLGCRELAIRLSIRPLGYLLRSLKEVQDVKGHLN